VHADTPIPKDENTIFRITHAGKVGNLSDFSRVDSIPAKQSNVVLDVQRLAARGPLQGRKDNMLNFNRVTLIGYTGADAKTFTNGPTTLSLATNANWTDEQTNQRQIRTAWHLLVVWNDLGKWAAMLPKRPPLFVDGELIYDEYQKAVDAVADSQTVQAQVTTRVAKIRVQKLIRLDPAATAQQEGKA
jgi:single-stranded DNA-binding protein